MTHLINSTSLSSSVAEVDLRMFQENITTFSQRLSNHVRLLAVVKSNAYGHGILEASHAAVKAGVERLGVSSIREGIFLRENGIHISIQLLSTIPVEQVADAVSNDLTVSVSTKRLAYALSDEAVRQNRIVHAHLKIDTGLHRFGIDPAEAVDFCHACYELPGLYWEGVYTHFSSADEGEWETTEHQYLLFKQTVENMKTNGFDFHIHHVGGSTIAIERADMHLNMVRIGLALFGLYPANRQKDQIYLNPVMKVTTKILQLKQLPKDTPVGYGGSYITRRNESLAVLPIGYGDGYKRNLSSRGSVLVNGIRARIVGTISLDQTIINITNIPNVNEGDEVVLIGEMGGDEITVQEMAGWINTVPDEIVCNLMERIERKYVTC